MRYGFIRKIINSPFPTKQCGHLSQTEELFVYHDDLEARILYLATDKQTILHISADILGIDSAARLKLQDYAKEYFKDAELHLITSATHTHYANDARNPRYVAYFIKVVEEGIRELKLAESDDIKVQYQMIKYAEIGKSRISGYESNNEYLSLIRFAVEGKAWLNLIIHNCHPTILQANVPYFSAEFPGYVLRQLRLHYPQEEFTYISGASGDISTRFTRPNQAYEAVEFLGNKLVAKIKELKANKVYAGPLKLDYREEAIAYDYEFNAIDLSNIRTNISQRERETIGFGQKMRAMMEKNKDMLPSEATLAALDLGVIRIVFYPNEIFSTWLDALDLRKSILVSYSNGYGPYIIPLHFPYLTYESFYDCLTDKTKETIVAEIKAIGSIN